MLLDPLEEQFDLPAAFVEGADGRGRQPELIGDEHQCLARLRVPETDPAQMLGIAPAGVVTIEGDSLIADDPCRPVGWLRNKPDEHPCLIWHE